MRNLLLTVRLLVVLLSGAESRAQAPNSEGAAWEHIQSLKTQST